MKKIRLIKKIPNNVFIKINKMFNLGINNFCYANDQQSLYNAIYKYLYSYAYLYNLQLDFFFV